MRSLILILCFCANLLPAAPLKTAALLAAGKEPVRIVCIGDSITGVYYHSGGMRAYPEMLQIALQKLHPKAKVIVRNRITRCVVLGRLRVPNLHRVVERKVLPRHQQVGDPGRRETLAQHVVFERAERAGLRGLERDDAGRRGRDGEDTAHRTADSSRTGRAGDDGERDGQAGAGCGRDGE